MEKKLTRHEYSAPEAEVIGASAQSFICASDLSLYPFEDGGTF